MLNQMRKALKGVGAWFIIILLILAFALWGVPEVRDFTRRAPLRVGDEAYAASTIQEEFNRQVAQRRSQREEGYTREDALADGLPDVVVSTLATRSVLEQEADKMGLVMPRSLVRDYLQEDERFQNPATGKFDQFALQNILQSLGMSVRQFEALIKGDLLRGQLVDAAAAGPAAPKALSDALLLREVERRRVGHLTITDEMAGVPEEPTPDALAAYYEDNKSSFFAPEYRTFTMVVLRNADFAEGLEAPEEDLRQLYEASRASLYEKPEKRTIYQITYDSEGEAQAAASALRQGRPFESLATDRGLTLAAVTFTEIDKDDILDPSVAEVAFAPDLAEGDVAGPVKSLFGWTVVQLAGLTPPETRTFEDVRDELEARYLEEDTRQRLFDATDEMELARDTGASLQAAAEEAGVTAQKVGPVDAYSFAPGGAIVADIPGKVLEEAFKLDEGEESEAIELDGEGYFYVQIDSVTPPAAKPYDEIADEVAARWRADERRRRIATVVAQIKDAMAAGQTLTEAAEPFNRAILETVLERRGAADGFSAALIEEIFNAELDAVVAGSAGSGEAQTIAEIRQIGFARSRLGPGESTGFHQYLSYQLNQEYLEAYVTGLREDYGVKIDQTLVSQLFSEGL